MSAVTLVFVARNEGTVFHTYRDQGGVITACTGHTDKSLRMGMTFTKAQCDAFEASDLKIAATAVDQSVTVPINDNQHSALVDFAFNVGVTKFESSHMLKFLNGGCYSCAANEFPKWDIVAGKHNPGVHARRLRAQALFTAKV